MSILSGKSIPEGSRRKEVLKRKEQEVPALRKKARITNSTKEGEVPAQKSKIPMTRGANLLALSQEKKKRERSQETQKKAKKERMENRQHALGGFAGMFGPHERDEPGGDWDFQSASSKTSSMVTQSRTPEKHKPQLSSLRRPVEKQIQPHPASPAPTVRKDGFNPNQPYELGSNSSDGSAQNEKGDVPPPQLSSLASSSRPKRITKNEKEEQEKKELDDFLSVTDDRQHGLQKFDDKVKGRCVKVRRSLSLKLTAHSLYHTFQATRQFKDGERVCEYVGDLITGEDAKIKEKEYDKNPEVYGSYMYFFRNGGKDYW